MTRTTEESNYRSNVRSEFRWKRKEKCANIEHSHRMTCPYGLSLSVSPPGDLFVFNKFEKSCVSLEVNGLHAYTAITGDLLDRRIVKKGEESNIDLNLNVIITLRSLCLYIHTYVKCNQKATLNQ